MKDILSLIFRDPPIQNKIRNQLLGIWTTFNILVKL